MTLLILFCVKSSCEVTSLGVLMVGGQIDEMAGDVMAAFGLENWFYRLGPKVKGQGPMTPLGFRFGPTWVEMLNLST